MTERRLPWSTWDPNSLKTDQFARCCDSGRHVEFRVHVQWIDAQRVVKLVFPWRLHEPLTIAGASYSFQVRPPNGDEEVFQGWLDHFDERDGRGIALTSDHLYGYDATDSETRVTLL